ncbi:MAG: C4-dicarboxylate ABC transporter substrate-binding protein [Treponema sp. GWB1_62_6]|nr:MAG: C4-dicarboxylate ABC transporter substrate-binding protein [Treponema sp. GWA1_62_8]OHE63739.1 MAG: C4-dicarboxylate ABC transporter substrate-binding protein [Treponema sp. GWC1_61_84]OHE69272.1 MAG: C4-dicarboxylate ABC transporter substrate-binding protein [Treponema sp. RIFOXYC1_FULL_61_9]OHE72591.1 MAG: C4-dicarboxylate ABC transporter substrate-binding protein [Treponema sp. GWB1_62_6]HCM28021.1 C4-dicarboxylate ABC transporter substrate-binding protein [Treponema sp.]
MSKVKGAAKLAAAIVFSVLVPALTFGAPQSNLILATGGTSGTYYPFGGAMAQIWNKSIANMNVTAQSTGASKENIRLVGRGEADLAMVQNDVMDYAFKGIELFAGEKVEGFRTIAVLYPEFVQIVVSPSSGINSVADMKGKRISVGDAGSGVEANAKQILEAYGLSFDDVKAARLSFKESASGLKDKQLDGFFVTGGIPNAAIQELSALAPVKILAIDDAGAARIQAAYKFYTRVTIPKGTYRGVDADAKTLAVNATLIVRKDLGDAVVYDITKALFEKQPELASAHAKGKELTLKGAVDGVSVDFHPGALKYYKEKGIK